MPCPKPALGGNFFFQRTVQRACVCVGHRSGHPRQGGLSQRHGGREDATQTAGMHQVLQHTSQSPVTDLGGFGAIISAVAQAGLVHASIVI